MLKILPLFSSSKGNCTYIESGTTALLVDIGISCKRLVNSFDENKINPNSIEAILVTHEHSDHTKGIGVFSKKYNVPVFANSKTWEAISKEQVDKISDENRKTFNIEESFNIGELKVFPFGIPHDAADPCGFNLYQDTSKISIATDLGHMTPSIFKHLEKSSFILLESNYEPEVLKFSKYPYILKKRIDGPNGHLSNIIAGKTISKLIPLGLNTAMLGHLSKENNFPELAYKTVMEELEKEKVSASDISLSVASRSAPSTLIRVS